jgi:hypothetical protein
MWRGLGRECEGKFKSRGKGEGQIRHNSQTSGCVKLAISILLSLYSGKATLFFDSSWTFNHTRFFSLGPPLLLAL